MLRASTRAPAQHSSSSSAAEADVRHSAASRQKHQTTIDAFLGLGKRSPPVSGELLRSFFDAIPEPNKAASALKSVASLLIARAS